MREIDRPEPNGGCWYQPAIQPGFHWVTGRAAWVVWRASERRRQRKELPVLFALWAMLVEWVA